jgi:transcriptional regulator
MSTQFTVYTAEAIAKIHAMKAAGKKSAEIARAIGTTTNSLSARMSQLGITKAKPRSEIAA